MIIKINKEKYVLNEMTVGDFTQIEVTKQLLTANQYGQMARNPTKTTNVLLDIVDAISYFGTLSEQFAKQYPDYTKLTLRETQFIVKTYKSEEVQKWLNDQMFFEDEETEDSKKSDIKEDV
jgi:hypothetical protein